MDVCEFPITALAILAHRFFPLEIDEHDQLGAKDTKERSVTRAYENLNTLVFDKDSWFSAR